MISLFKDEKGSVSTPRVLLFIYTGFIFHISLRKPELLTPDMFSFLALVFSLMTGWAGGARLAQYIFPNLTSLFKRFGRGELDRVDVTASTDIQEIIEMQEPEKG